MKVAIIHYWLVGMRGGEKVLESLIDLYPQSDIYTNVYIPSNISDKINNQKVYTTFINNIPLSKKFYKYLLILMPFALRVLNLKKYDLIISSESGPSKGIVKRSNAKHICYCHSPMRYIWEMKEDYTKNLNLLMKIATKIFFPYLKKWDIKSAKNIDMIVTNSNFVKDRVRKYWNQNACVVHPPVKIDEFNIVDEVDDYYLVLSQLVEYKRIDIAIKGFNKYNKKLVVIGEGDELNNLKKIAQKNILFLGWQSEENKKKYLSRCKALIFPGIEDFGIVPIETMASGRPVIALKIGGALDYIINMENGVFFNEQSSDSLLEALNKFENNSDKFNSDLIKKSVRKFNYTVFNQKIKKIIDDVRSK